MESTDPVSLPSSDFRGLFASNRCFRRIEPGKAQPNGAEIGLLWGDPLLISHRKKLISIQHRQSCTLEGMLFSSPVFLFAFIPIVLAVYFLLPRRDWNTWLLIASLFFYAWGEKAFVLVMLASITLNFIFGLLVEKFKGRSACRFVILVAVAVNLGLLVGYKYANFLVDSLNHLLMASSIPVLKLSPVHLPIGISFFTFHALSYVIDVYRSHARAQRNPINLALYITLFPQLVAGPILRFHEISGQLYHRTVSWEAFSYGIQRFIVGLAKKMLLANPLAANADAIFRINDASLLSPTVAWGGAIFYTLQIYFDFSGYSDMAVGLGKMFGFDFPENFNYPYTACSIQDFWRRWHISLSTWFRDYLYIPLGGNRGSNLRTHVNLITVFFLCGLWHGASWTFVAWGLYHGTFLILERPISARRMQNRWKPLRRVLTLLIVIVGWVFFRANDFGQATIFLKAMFGFAPQIGKLDAAVFPDSEIKIVFVCGILAAMPIAPLLERVALAISRSLPRFRSAFDGCFEATQISALTMLLLLSMMRMAAGTYNPFIYFRF
jgi:alginate O-acetyltransferase complex protein AlgI